MDKEKYNKINNILSDWDPIEVGDPISRVEYSGYIPKIYDSYLKSKDLRRTIINILKDDLGLSINENNNTTMSEVDQFLDKLYRVLK